MTTPIKVEIIQRETIKPSSPTPHHLRNFKLSLYDQHDEGSYFTLILFYTSDDNGDPKIKSSEKSQLLKESLSESLTYFYPLAGRIKDDYWVDCNDDGVDYLEARVNCKLSNILESPNSCVLNPLLPIKSGFAEAPIDRLLLVQASFFECGGMAMGMGMTHKLADAATLSTFIKNWVTIAHKSSEVVPPEFNGASLFPPIDFPIKYATPDDKLQSSNFITRRYVFDASKVALLKTKVVSPNVQQPTRVEAVSALIWKCSMTASRTNLGFVKPSLLMQAVNMRKRLVSPLPENSFGNFADCFQIETEGSEIGLHELVGRMRKGMGNFCDNYANKLLGKEGVSMICEAFKNNGNVVLRDDMDVYWYSSWCKFPFYDSDFGWGKPIWLGFTFSCGLNFVTLMDTRDGKGIEAWVNLSEQDMALFEHDKELLQFASVNPSVLD